jgi:hypothetical protein
MDDWRTACRRYFTGSQSLLLIKFSDLRSKIGVAGQLQLDNPPLLDYSFFAPAQSGVGIGLLREAAQPQPLRFFCAYRTAFLFGGLGGAAVRLAGASPVDQLRSVRLPMIGLVRSRVYNQTEKQS